MKGTRQTDGPDFDLDDSHVRAKPHTMWVIVAAIAVASSMGTAAYLDIKATLRAHGEILSKINAITPADITVAVRTSEQWAWDLFASNRDNVCPKPLWMFRGPDHMDCKLALPTWARP